MKYENIIQGLKNVYDRATKLGEDISELTGLTSDPRVKSLVTELENQAYSLAIDAKDSAEDYRDISEEQNEAEMSSFDKEIPENPEGEESEEPSPEEAPMEEPTDDTEDEELEFSGEV